MRVYPFSSPIILNDDVFVQYGGQVGLFSPAQRNAAYLIAEQQMSTYVDTLLLPQDVTGSVVYSNAMRYVTTDYGYVNQIHGARVLDAFGVVRFELSGTSSYIKIQEDTYGYLYIVDTVSHCCSCYDGPMTLQFMYNAGMPTGMANQPAMLLALTMAAQISLNEMGFPTMNEGVGDVGITEFSHLQYKETRKRWKNSSFGASARSSKIAQLVDSTIRKARRALVLGRI